MPFYVDFYKSYTAAILDGGHFGFMLITQNAQSVQLGIRRFRVSRPYISHFHLKTLRYSQFLG